MKLEKLKSVFDRKEIDDKPVGKIEEVFFLDKHMVD
jgi:hypothetical protein